MQSEHHEKLWRKQLERLKAYQKEYVDCNVPLPYLRDRPLGIWVQKQRAAYHREELNTEHIAALNEVGFIWDLNEYGSCELIVDLAIFYARHGHFRVSYFQDQQLGGRSFSRATILLAKHMNEHEMELLRRIDPTLPRSDSVTE